MTQDDASKRERTSEERAKVNPAARHDRPGEDPPGSDEERRPGRQVPPDQEEPLDPLGPGGIGE
jgi:hypothetical protein